MEIGLGRILAKVIPGLDLLAALRYTLRTLADISRVAVLRRGVRRRGGKNRLYFFDIGWERDDQMLRNLFDNPTIYGAAKSLIIKNLRSLTPLQEAQCQKSVVACEVKHDNV